MQSVDTIYTVALFSFLFLHPPCCHCIFAVQPSSLPTLFNLVVLNTYCTYTTLSLTKDTLLATFGLKILSWQNLIWINLVFFITLPYTYSASDDLFHSKHGKGHKQLISICTTHKKS